MLRAWCGQAPRPRRSMGPKHCPKHLCMRASNRCHLPDPTIPVGRPLGPQAIQPGWPVPTVQFCQRCRRTAADRRHRAQRRGNLWAGACYVPLPHDTGARPRPVRTLASQLDVVRGVERVREPQRSETRSSGLGEWPDGLRRLKPWIKADTRGCHRSCTTSPRPPRPR